MAARMVRDGTVPETPEQLDAWIANSPDARETLERDGYNTDFTADDLFPLLQVFVTQAGGQIAPAAEPPRSHKNWWLVAFLVLLFVLLVYALITNASAHTAHDFSDPRFRAG